MRWWSTPTRWVSGAVPTESGELRPGPGVAPLHAEPRTPDGFDGVGGPADLDLCRALTTEEIEQQLARKSSDANRGFPSPGSYRVGRPSPLELEPCAA